MDLITFNCSSCQQVLKVSADNVGKQAKCPRCGTAMVIPRASSAPAAHEEPPPADPYEDDDEPRSRRGRSRRADEEYEERPSRSRRREDDDEDDRLRRSRRRDEGEDDDDRSGRGRRRGGRHEEEDDYDRPRSKGMSQTKKWGFVRLGVLLVAISACILAGAAGMLTISHLISFIATLAEKSWKASMILGRIGNGLIFGASIVAVVGYVFCIFVPNRYGTLALAITSLALGAINLIFSLICRIITMLRDRFAGGIELALPGFGFISDSLGGAFAFSLIIILLFFAELIIFPLFISAVGKATKSRWASNNAMLVVIFASVAAGLAIAYVVMVFVVFNKLSGGSFPGKALQVITSLLGFLSALCFLVQTIFYTLLLFRSRDMIGN